MWGIGAAEKTITITTTNKQTKITGTIGTVAPYLCSIKVGAGSLSPDNDTLQLHDRGGRGDDDDDESRDGDDGHDDDVLQHVEDLRVVQVELRGHHVVHRDVGRWVHQLLHVYLEESKCPDVKVKPKSKGQRFKVYLPKISRTEDSFMVTCQNFGVRVIFNAVLKLLNSLPVSLSEHNSKETSEKNLMAYLFSKKHIYLLKLCTIYILIFFFKRNNHAGAAFSLFKSPSSSTSKLTVSFKLSCISDGQFLQLTLNLDLLLKV